MSPLPSSPGSIGLTSASLIDRIKTHDPDAWRRLVHLYGPLVMLWLRQARLQPADAQDVMQEVFQAVANGIGKFRREKTGDTFRGWLRMVVRSKQADHFRRLEKAPAAAGGTDARLLMHGVAAPDETLAGNFAEQEAQEEADALQQLRLRALEQLSEEFDPRTWEMFWRAVVLREDTADVARSFNVAPAAVRMNKIRVLRRLRVELGDLDS